MSEVDLRPAAARVHILRGVDVALQATLRHDGVAVDITQDAVVFQASGPDGLAITARNDPGEHTTPASGLTTFRLAPADTAGASAHRVTRCSYEVRRIVGGTLNEYVYAYGPLDIYPTLTE